jgi:hypothetical protein
VREGEDEDEVLYMATCDKAQVYPPGPGDCNTNPGVQLVVQNITFVGAAIRATFLVHGDGAQRASWRGHV